MERVGRVAARRVAKFAGVVGRRHDAVPTRGEQLSEEEVNYDMLESL